MSLAAVPHNHHFDESLRCACGVDWHDHQSDPQPCDSRWHQGRMQAERNAEIMRELGMGVGAKRVGLKYGISETQVRAIRRKAEEDIAS